jgi:GT2 family glycosyltransferase
MRRDEQIAVCGPRLLNSDGSLQPSAWRNPPAAWEIVVSGLGLWRLIPARIRGELLLGGHWDHASRRAVPMLFGAALLVRRRVVEAVGGLDERFHMYAEDNEWCLRITRAGWQVVFEPAATIVHHGAQFALQRWSNQERLRVKLRSYFDFQRYALSRTQVVRNLIAGCAVSGAQHLWRTLCRRGGGDADIVFAMHVADLKRVLRGSPDEGPVSR